MILDTQSDLVLLQFPLAQGIPNLDSLRIKEKGGILEATDSQQSQKLTGNIYPLFNPGQGNSGNNSNSTDEQHHYESS